MEEFMKLLSPRDILLHAINVVVLFVGIRLLLYKPIRRFMDGRAGRVAAQLDDAAAREQAADARKKQLEEAAQQAKIDAAQAIASGVQQGQKTADELLKRTRQQAQTIVEDAQAEAKQIQLEAKEAVRAQAINMAVEIAGKMLEREVKQADHQKIIDEFLTKVG